MQYVQSSTNGYKIGVNAVKYIHPYLHWGGSRNINDVMTPLMGYSEPLSLKLLEAVNMYDHGVSSYRDYMIDMLVTS